MQHLGINTGFVLPTSTTTTNKASYLKKHNARNLQQDPLDRPRKKKTEYLIALHQPQLTERGPFGFGPIQFLMV